MKVVPAINVARDAETDAIRQVNAVRHVTDMIHVDVSDGTFSDAVTWSDATRWHEVAAGLRLQAHLMLAKPEKALEAWLIAGAAQVIVHHESFAYDAVKRIQVMAVRCALYGTQLIVAGGLTVSAEELLEHEGDTGGFLLLGVKPGYSGQPMDPRLIEKAQIIHTRAPNTDIWVDGGVNTSTIPALREAGVTAVIAASAVFGASDPAAALAALQLV